MSFTPKREGISNKRLLGTQYELLAIAYLEAKHYTILEHSYRCRFGEIDIIAKDDEYIVFVEVKYRKRVDYGYPREAVNYKKRQHILRTAMYYLRTKIGYEVASRFDVIEILETSITHLEAAF